MSADGHTDSQQARPLFIVYIVGWEPGWEALRSNPVINGVARQ